MSFEARTDEVHVRHDTAVSLGLIANEFVTNSAKHAFPKAPGSILLELKALENQQISLTLSDNGIGISPQNRRSSGLQLIAGLAEQLGADAEWDVEAGTRLRLRLSASSTPVQDTPEPKEKPQHDTNACLHCGMPLQRATHYGSS
jgi:two-component sensor histidine kinase